MRIVLDASAGVGLSATDHYKNYRQLVADAAWVGVPSLYDFEVANTVWKYQTVGGWSLTDGETVLERALALPDDRQPGGEFAAEALALARMHKHPAYDMFYVALARRHDAVLLSLDRRLLKIARAAGARVHQPST